MTAAHAGVDYLQLLRLHLGVLGTDLLQPLLHLRLLRGFVQIILPLRLIKAGMALVPQAAKAVLHHVAHDPVRGKQLGRRWDVLLADLDVLFQVGKHLVLGLGVVILVHPADDLHLTHGLAFFIGGMDIEPALIHLVDQTVNHTVGVAEAEHHQQLRIAAVALQIFKQPGQNAAQIVALLEEHKTEQIIFLVGILQVEDMLLFRIGKLQITRKGRLDQIGQLLACNLAGKYPHRDIAVDLHKVDGNQAVEPCKGDLLNKLLQLLLGVVLGVKTAHMCNKVLILVYIVLALDSLGVAVAKVKNQFFLRAGLRLHNAFFSDAVALQLERHIRDQLTACFHRKFFDGCLFHSVPLFVVRLTRYPRSGYRHDPASASEHGAAFQYKHPARQSY